MKSQEDLISILGKICQKDKRYKIDAYTFVLVGLNQVMEKLEEKRHITGAELTEGIKELAIKEYGRMAKTVLEHWGITKTEDFGNIVFNMIDEKVLGRTDSDSIDDFKALFDFKQVFEEEFKY